MRFTSSPMRRKLVLLAAAATLCGAAGVASLAAAANGGSPDAALTCVSPTDPRGIDAILRSAGSPLAGQGGTFVAAGVRAGLDPRLLVAIAAQETMLETYGPARAIHNAFGMGPGIAYASDAAGINAAADNLARGYIADGVTTISAIAQRWAPSGAANDPGNLNASWPSGVGQFFRELGGNPDAPVLLTAQPTGCVGGAAQTMVTVKPLGAVRATLIQGPDDRGGTHDPAFNLAGGSYNWQSIWAVDLGVPVGTPVYAVFPGRIVTVHSGGSGRFAGIGVGLESGRGLAAYYAHLSTVRIAPGQTVAAGQEIGTTGEANGVAHLHFALGRSYDNGNPSNGLDPRPFIAHAAVSATAAVVQLRAAVAPRGDLIPLGSGRPVVTVWGGNIPSVTGPGPSGGDTPGTTTPATVADFAFPLAVRPGGKVRYTAPNCANHVFCSVALHAHAGTVVVAASAGALEAGVGRRPLARCRILDRHPGLRTAGVRAAGHIRARNRSGDHRHCRPAARDHGRHARARMDPVRSVGQSVAAADRRAPHRLGHSRPHRLRGDVCRVRVFHVLFGPVRVVGRQSGHPERDRRHRHQARQSTGDDRKPRRGHCGNRPGLDIAQPRAARHHKAKDGRDPTPQRVRGQRLGNGRATHGAHAVGGACDRKQHRRRPQGRHEPGRGDHQPPHRHRREHDPSEPAGVGHPAGG